MSQNRIIEVNVVLENYCTKARNLLSSKEGIKKRKQRYHDVEAVFGNIKANHGCRSFMLRG
ncbi:transposase [Flavobacterium sp. JP2137]|uniref:transposase n=1 Tax=Flavobacterium sp. JP2137 TaxID=3414510 RepID=UPI003D2FDB3E